MSPFPWTGVLCVPGHDCVSVSSFIISAVPSGWTWACRIGAIPPGIQTELERVQESSAKLFPAWLCISVMGELWQIPVLRLYPHQMKPRLWGRPQASQASVCFEASHTDILHSQGGKHRWCQLQIAARHSHTITGEYWFRGSSTRAETKLLTSTVAGRHEVASWAGLGPKLSACPTWGLVPNLTPLGCLPLPFNSEIRSRVHISIYILLVYHTHHPPDDTLYVFYS